MKDIPPNSSETESERQIWLAESEAALAKTWDNPADDVFNLLLEQ